MKYIILSYEKVEVIRDNANNFEQDFRIKVGIDGDAHGLSVSDTTTASWSKDITGTQAETVEIPNQLQSFVDGKYNS